MEFANEVGCIAPQGPPVAFFNRGAGNLTLCLKSYTMSPSLVIKSSLCTIYTIRVKHLEVLLKTFKRKAGNHDNYKNWQG